MQWEISGGKNIKGRGEERGGKAERVSERKEEQVYEIVMGEGEERAKGEEKGKDMKGKGGGHVGRPAKR